MILWVFSYMVKERQENGLSMDYTIGPISPTSPTCCYVWSRLWRWALATPDIWRCSVLSVTVLLMLLTKHHVLMILWVFTYVPIAAQAVSPWAGSQGSPEFGDVWGAIHHLRDADHTVLYVYVYTRMCIVYTYTHSVGVIRGHCGSTHESTESQLLYKSPTPKHLLIGEIIQNKINSNDGTKKHGKLNTHMKHKVAPSLLIIFWS